MLLKLPGNNATVLVAFAATGGTPSAISAGKVRRVPPPATAFMALPTAVMAAMVSSEDGVVGMPAVIYTVMSTVPGLKEVQIFGTKKHSDTRKAERFFKERNVRVHFVDFGIRAPARGELQRFAQKFGVDALIDRQSRRFQELGLGPSRYGEERWLEILADEPLLLVQPLVRYQQQVTVGLAEKTWKEWMGR